MTLRTTRAEARRRAGLPPFDALLRDLRASPPEEWPAHLTDVSLLDVAPHLSFRPERYTRTPLAADEGVELLLMGWLPGQASAIHDHGLSHGAALVLAGEAEEDLFELRDGRAWRTSTIPLSRGQSILERQDGIHRLRNAGTHLLVTLHAYAPRLREYRTYEP